MFSFDNLSIRIGTKILLLKEQESELFFISISRSLSDKSLENFLIILSFYTNRKGHYIKLLDPHLVYETHRTNFDWNVRPNKVDCADTLSQHSFVMEKWKLIEIFGNIFHLSLQIILIFLISSRNLPYFYQMNTIISCTYIYIYILVSICLDYLKFICIYCLFIYLSI